MSGGAECEVRNTGLVSPVNRQAVSLPYIKGAEGIKIKSMIMIKRNGAHGGASRTGKPRPTGRRQSESMSESENVIKALLTHAVQFPGGADEEVGGSATCELS